MNLVVIDQRGIEHSLSARSGITIMEVIRDAGLAIAAQCGGCCSCATCHVYVDPQWQARLAPQSDDENIMLELAQEPRAASRLACQIAVSDELDGLRLTLAPGTEL